MTLNSELKNLIFLVNSGITFFIQNSSNSIYQSQKEKKKSTHENKIKKVSDIETLSQLKEYIKNSNTCELKNHAFQVVFADGNPDSKIMLVGEAPGADEDKYGKPFVGKAGKLLDKMLASIGLDRSKVYISNVLPWRPPGNRQPTTEEILQCLPFIQKHIEMINPSILILLGGTAAKALLTSTQGITQLRKKWHQYNSLNLEQSILTRAIFHPAFLLRSPEHKKETWEDLQEIKRNIQNETI
tara:strand:+ start:26 stop:751 length:726 start_codon:yes stop_codon:yes gene_type:complete